MEPVVVILAFITAFIFIFSGYFVAVSLRVFPVKRETENIAFLVLLYVSCGFLSCYLISAYSTDAGSTSRSCVLLIPIFACLAMIWGKRDKNKNILYAPYVSIPVMLLGFVFYSLIGGVISYIHTPTAAEKHAQSGRFIARSYLSSSHPPDPWVRNSNEIED